jgi:hypothetical protein
VSYARWAQNTLNNSMSFEELWKSFDEIKYVGRYAGMRITEALARADIVPDGWVKDIRAAEGGWSPRLMLSYFQPQHDEVLNAPPSKKTTSRVEYIASDIWHTTMDKIGPISMYNFESSVCNFKQGLEARRYPGHALDNDLEAINLINKSFCINSSRLFQLRSEIHPHTCLGEIQGWQGYREELSTTMKDHGFWWDDTLYDYDVYARHEGSDFWRQSA